MEIYLGIYIRAERKTEDEVISWLVCPKGCPVMQTQKYCHHCGSELVIKKETAKKRINLHTMFSNGTLSCEFEDDFLMITSQNGLCDILIPNYNPEFGDFLEEVEGEYDSSLFVHFKEFKEKYAPFIKAIEPLYKKISYEYGVVLRYD